MTVEQWLAIPDDKLPTALAEVLTPQKHTWEDDIMQVPGLCNLRHRCSRCFMRIADSVKADHIYDCIPDPITIDWNTAMEWRDKTVKQNLEAWETAIHDVSVVGREPYDSLDRFLEGFSQPKHYLIAAALATERKEE